jgi:hypothetical protein
VPALYAAWFGVARESAAPEPTATSADPALA